MGAKYSARLEAQPRPPAARRVMPVVQQLAVLDRGTTAGGEGGLVHGAVGLALEVQRPLVGQHDGLRPQPMYLERAAGRRRPNVRGQLTRRRPDGDGARAEE